MPKEVISVDGELYRVDDTTGIAEKVTFAVVKDEPTQRKIMAELTRRAKPNMQSLNEVL